MIDAHAHLTDPRLASDLDAVIGRATAAGIERILSCGDDLASSGRTVELAGRHDAVRAAVGVHPHHAMVWSDAVADGLRRLATDEHVVAIGEIGLDFSGRSAPREAQERAFSAQLALARELDLPVVVHVRDAGDAARAIIDSAPTGTYGMIHCYSEGRDQIDAWLGRDFLISFAGPLTYPKNDALRAAATVPPATALLVETDAPYLAPQARRGERNEPAFVLETLAAMAAARGAAPEALGATIAENARRLFGARWV
jgi:TatD DNase family protein